MLDNFEGLRVIRRWTIHWRRWLKMWKLGDLGDKVMMEHIRRRSDHLETVATFRLLPNDVQHRVDQLGALRLLDHVYCLYLWTKFDQCNKTSKQPRLKKMENVAKAQRYQWKPLCSVPWPSCCPPRSGRRQSCLDGRSGPSPPLNILMMVMKITVTMMLLVLWYL